MHVYVDYDLEWPRVHKRIPSGDFMCTTNSDGERFYVKLKDEIAMTKEVNFCVLSKQSYVYKVLYISRNGSLILMILCCQICFPVRRHWKTKENRSASLGFFWDAAWTSWETGNIFNFRHHQTWLFCFSLRNLCIKIY